MKRQIKKSYSAVITAMIFFVLAIILLVCSVLAWFFLNDKSDFSAPNLIAKDDENNNFAIISINEDVNFSETGFYIWPNDEFHFELKTIRDESDFSIRFEVQKLSDDLFESNLSREDLLRGPYEKLTILNNGTENFEKYFDYDADKNFDNGQKINFLKKFTDNNNIVSAFSAEIIKINNEILINPVSLKRDSEDSLFLYPEEDLIFNENDIVFIRLVYGRRILEGGEEWVPKMSINSGFSLPEFRALNLNCFIGQTVEVSFVSRFS